MVLDFYLEALDTEFTLGENGQITGVELADPTSGLPTATVEVALSVVQGIFKFQTDSADITDSVPDDIKYYINYAGTGPFSTINPAELNIEAATGGLFDAAASGKKTLAHDYIRHLADKLFNTHFGVDLFNNEEELLASVVAGGNTVKSNISSVLSAISMTSTNNAVGLVGTTPNRYLTDATLAPDNICKAILEHMVHQESSRFTGIAASAEAQSLPFQVNDALVFKLTVHSHADQKVAIGETGPVADRDYRIKIKVIANPA
jgi:hypothetical protein